MSRIIVPMVADLLHLGHLSIINKALHLSKDTTVGLHTDQFVKEYKGEIPTLTFDERKDMLEGFNIQVVELDSWEIPFDFDYVMHGNDWQPPYIMAKHQGYITVPCFDGITSTEIKERIRNA